ncbi:hypothetical protein [Deinococcus detaillensis]|uniref:hypothetical protein n=1 Tax=Deinococcus detaillensis TaxID=2592048 RepID=UPI00163DD1CD|nr:hypothetical protein [Deinococcus detaillensis]
MGLLFLGGFIGLAVWMGVRQARLNKAMRQMGDGPEGSGPYVGPNYAGPPE